MSVDATIRNAITLIVPVCVPQIYTGTETEYCVFNYSELPTDFGDNAPHAIRYLAQLHWFVPWRTESGAAINPNTKKKQIKQALLNADFTYPGVVNASDADGQHFVFEFEAVDGDV